MKITLRRVLKYYRTPIYISPLALSQRRILRLTEYYGWRKNLSAKSNSSWRLELLIVVSLSKLILYLKNTHFLYPSRKVQVTTAIFRQTSTGYACSSWQERCRYWVWWIQLSIHYPYVAAIFERPKILGWETRNSRMLDKVVRIRYLRTTTLIEESGSSDARSLLNRPGVPDPSHLHTIFERVSKGENNNTTN